MELENFQNRLEIKITIKYTPMLMIIIYVLLAEKIKMAAAK